MVHYQDKDKRGNVPESDIFLKVVVVLRQKIWICYKDFFLISIFRFLGFQLGSVYYLMSLALLPTQKVKVEEANLYRNRYGFFRIILRWPRQTPSLSRDNSIKPALRLSASDNNESPLNLILSIQYSLRSGSLTVM